MSDALVPAAEGDDRVAELVQAQRRHPARRDQEHDPGHEERVLGIQGKPAGATESGKDTAHDGEHEDAEEDGAGPHC
ncbi:hypothetical protein GCM10023192_60440 [Amycolatopsis samaneae]